MFALPRSPLSDSDEPGVNRLLVLDLLVSACADCFRFWTAGWKVQYVDSSPATLLVVSSQIEERNSDFPPETLLL